MGGERVEEFSINGDELLAKVRQLVREGNVRRATIKNENGDTLIVIPLTIGVIGAALLPVLRGDRRPGGAGHSLHDRGRVVAAPEDSEPGPTTARPRPVSRRPVPRCRSSHRP